MEMVTEEEEEHIQRAAARESGAFDLPDLSANNVSQTQQKQLQLKDSGIRILKSILGNP